MGTCRDYRPNQSFAEPSLVLLSFVIKNLQTGHHVTKASSQVVV